MNTDEEERQFLRAFQARLTFVRVKVMAISQREMAKRLKIPEARYAKYETRSHFPLYLLPRLIIETERPYSYWVFGIEPGSPGIRTAKLRVINQ
jgi:hypothetical protein